MTAPAARPSALLTIGLCSQRGRSSSPYRRYMLETALQSADVWLFDIPGQVWPDGMVLGRTEVDVFDRAATVAAARRLAEDVDILGVWGPDEATIVTAAAVAEELGLPGLGVSAATAARDKAASRAAFRAAGIPQPESIPVENLEAAHAAARRVGYPLVLKPRALGASLGVVRVDDESQLAEGYAAASSARYPGTPVFDAGVLVESFVVGPEVSIDGVCHDGVYRPLFLAHKRLGFAPFFEEIGHVVDGADPLLRSTEMLDVLERAHAALGLGTGVTHTEVRLTDRGPVVIEVNGRPGGDLIPQLGRHASGRDAIDVAVQVALVRPPSLAESTDRAAVVRFLYPDGDCRIDAVDLAGMPSAAPTGASAGEDTAVWAAPLVDPGTELRLPPRGYVSRWAYVMARGPSVEECDRAADAAASRTSLAGAPLAVMERA